MWCARTGRPLNFARVARVRGTFTWDESSRPTIVSADVIPPWPPTAELPIRMASRTRDDEWFPVVQSELILPFDWEQSPLNASFGCGMARSLNW